jgi:hypothetical protein
MCQSAKPPANDKTTSLRRKIGQRWLVPVRLGRKGAAPGTSLICGLGCHERHAAPKTMRLLYDTAKHDTIPYTNRSALSYRDIVRYRDIAIYDAIAICDIPHPAEQWLDPPQHGSSAPSSLQDAKQGVPVHGVVVKMRSPISYPCRNAVLCDPMQSWSAYPTGMRAKSLHSAFSRVMGR